MKSADPETDKIIGNFTMRQLAELVEAHERYNRWNFQYPHPLTEGVTIYYTFDSEDGWKQWKEFQRTKGGAKIWGFTLVWEQTRGDTYDFIKMEKRATSSTAYKMSKLLPGFDEVKYKLAGCWPSTGSNPAQAAADVEALDILYRTLDKTSSSLSNWLSSTFAGLAVCGNCRHETTFPSPALRHFHERGLTVEGLKSRLRCERCGKKNALLLPVTLE
ncbi:hypothetical protein [Rhizobium anhuiense]|uniref:Uncharacterized protein n=1 Tax=Rhizobium anhuiense TaxID=1184720 RepID=A0A3S0RZ53_9HYPH|nr:hypothetical protein [Rhizobium anhuiense]RUL96779.1 hypothetical protein EEQ99_29065 [Rhizobium anhuiense]GGE08910.1 hypothetical protein GCM10008012_59730 [Rhizobium anhuiense]